jgi:hypothetical protein
MNILKTIGLIATLLAATSAHSATVSVDPVTTNVTLGTTFTVDVVGTGFPVTEGGGFSLGFDASVLQVTNVTVDNTTWAFSHSTGSLDNGSGTLDDVWVADFSFPGISGDFVVATIEFQATGVGTSGLSLAASALNPWACSGVSCGESFDQSASVTVSAIPLPAAAWLFGSALLGLVTVSSRRK